MSEIMRFVTLVLVFVSAAHAGWEPNVFSSDSPLSPTRASISYAAAPQYGLATLSAALEKLQEDGHIDHLGTIVLYGGQVDPEFQQQVINKLKEYAPREFEIASTSGGATYANPALDPLHKVFDEIVLDTATVAAIDDQLNAVGKRVSSASHEKLSFRGDGERLSIHFFLYLVVEDS